MASPQHYSLFLISLTLLILSTNAQSPLIITLPIHLDTKTFQFYTTIHMGSNRAPINAILDLGGPFPWFACDNYVSNTYSPVPCGSARCETAKGIGCVSCNLPLRPGCTNDTCAASPYNPYLDMLFAEGFAEDTLSLATARVPGFIFSCMHAEDLDGLARGTTGMLGLARTETSVHRQVARSLGLRDKFSLCFPSSSGTGKLSIGLGSGPTPGLDGILKSTTLIINPVSTYPIYTTGDPSDEYFIDVQSIRVAGRQLSVKSSYFSIDKEGVGGTKISTIRNFTSLHNSIYMPFTRAFVKAASDLGIKSVGGVGSFRACFSTRTIRAVPDIDLVLPGRDVYWRISGANSMVEVDGRTTCLAFVDGGRSPRTAVVIGARQLEDNYLEFDLVNSRLSFSSSLLVHNKSCSS
ncbi:Eukaryotic aspartyl protease family protein [Striga hermonthica]|uniref:Eukaryotic aspartyl protease family protein n=1 Tax=Striga hermonthica TaxID=68872 RepID=A0A9N7NIR8_STRHE|nr:Eukaryotic aspartyl protease family protein [Striga hermonthica]